MTATPPDDVAAMFDLPPLPAAAAPDEAALEADEAALAADEAALAAEIAATIGSGAFAADAPDSRSNLRVKVSWPARMQLPDGQVLALTVRDISESGVGLVSDEHLPADTLVSFEMDVPPFEGRGEITTVKGTIRTTYTVAQGPEVLCGGTWQQPPAGLALLNQWIETLRG